MISQRFSASGSNVVVAAASISIAGVLLVAAAGTAEGQESQPPDTFKSALAQGKGKVTLRYRFELVEQEGFEKDAEASTLRTTVSYATKPHRGWSFFVEAENVTTTDDDAYRNAGAGSLSNGVLDRPVVADPEITEINQYWAELARGAWTLRAGREGILLDNERFVGTVGWRQNHQTFDGVSVARDLGELGMAGYHFIANANRVFGDDHQMTTHLVHGRFELGEIGSLHALWLDFDNDTVVSSSTSTVGARFFGSKALDYSVALAHQTDRGDNPSRVAATYIQLELGGTLGAIALLGGWEVLEGSDEDGRFSTPLATLHKWNGWADQFLATPADGLEDFYLSVSGALGKATSWQAVYHDFQAESSARDLGSELDLQITYKTGWGQTFALKAALYDADQHAVDTNKIWFLSTYSFGN